MKKLLSMVAVVVLASVSGCTDSSRPEPGLVWSDEFDGSGPVDERSWNVATGNKEFDGWGNEELQYYTKDSLVRDGEGHLAITAEKAALDAELPCWNGKNCEYTSGRITSEDKVSMQNGRVEVRMKVPAGTGLWPAFWMLGSGVDEWPNGGEIDVMEWVGNETKTVYGTLHGPGYSDDAGVQGEVELPADLSDDFHVFAVEKRPERIQWQVDGKTFFEMTPDKLPEGKKWVFERPFYLLFNLAVGGPWPGSPTEETKFPATLLVDYARIYN
ncbi:family 16 glycosylhydrolase [Kribbella sp. NPDC056951]|uniref:glycoside hydrolase family 16 protein n=1 Tax=Kribbella sp. NPDC056951 TaxID=3345978 RepID=UPI00364406ED